jgi:anthranilate/para-aminobenzoate synthase component II
MRTLLVDDDDDSYTFNLVHLTGEVNGEGAACRRRDPPGGRSGESANRSDVRSAHPSVG